MIKNFIKLKERDDVYVLYATYDKKIDEAFFIPNTTWGEGRNFLLGKALEIKKQFHYFIFLDDDVLFLKGSFELFENQLLKYKPAIAVPVFVPKTRSSVIKIELLNIEMPKALFCYQQCRRADAQIIAFHKSVISDSLVVPLQTQFDKISWWFTSSTQQLMILNLYQKSFIQFNNIEVANSLHREYTNNEYKTIQKNWFSNQFLKPIEDPRPFAINLISMKNLKHILKKNENRIPLKYLIEFCVTIFNTLTYKKKENYHIKNKDIHKILNTNSEITKRYFSSSY